MSSAWPEACSCKAWAAAEWLFHSQGLQRSRCTLQAEPYGALRPVQTLRCTFSTGPCINNCGPSFKSMPWFWTGRKARGHKQL